MIICTTYLVQPTRIYGVLCLYTVIKLICLLSPYILLMRWNSNLLSLLLVQLYILLLCTIFSISFNSVVIIIIIIIIIIIYFYCCCPDIVLQIIIRKSRLTRDATAELVPRDQKKISGAYGDRGISAFPCSADSEQDWQPYPVDPYAILCDDYTYTYILIPPWEDQCECHVWLCFLPIHSGLQWTYQPGSHRKKVTQEEGNTGFFTHLLSAVLALIFLARRIQPFLSLVDREVEFCVLTI